MTWVFTGPATAADYLDHARGFVCPMPGGGAWASTTSFPGCKPAANYADAEREVSRLNAAVPVEGYDGVQPRHSEPAGGKPIYRCTDGAGRTIYADVPCHAPSKQRQLPAAAQSEGATEQATTRVLYDRAVAELEQRYPALNVDSPAFDAVLTQRVLRQKQVFVERSYGEVAALRAAVQDVMSTYRPPTATQAVLAAQPQQPAHSPNSIVEHGAKGLAMGVVYGTLGIAGALVWWVVRRWRAAAATAAIGIARAVGSASAKIDKNASGAANAIRQVRRPGRRRDKHPWE
jgi:hypothetical protein